MPRLADFKGAREFREAIKNFFVLLRWQRRKKFRAHAFGPERKQTVHGQRVAGLGREKFARNWPVRFDTLGTDSDPKILKHEKLRARGSDDKAIGTERSLQARY